MSIDFWSKFSPVDFNRDFAACLIFLPCTTSPAIFNPVFNASRSRVFAPLFNKGMAALKSPPKDTAKSMSSLISSSRKYWISFSCLVYVIIVVSFRIVTMGWFHSRENSFRFLQ